MAYDGDIDTALYTWFVQARQTGVPLSGNILKAQAEKLNKELNGPEDFILSDGWLWRWQKRHGIAQATISGEARSCDTEAANKFPNELRKAINDGGYLQL